ncbi:MAG TPA: ABC transporter ATP-binding protein [Streptosporangiaceae bacterium]
MFRRDDIAIARNPARFSPSYLTERFRQRRAAASQLAWLARRTCPGLALAVAILHMVVGVLPVVFMVSIGLALQQLARAVADGAAVGWLPGWLGLAAASFIVQQLLVPVQAAAGLKIMRRVDSYCASRLMRSASTLTSLRALEQPEVADAARDTSEALTSMAFTPGSATAGALALISRYTQLAGAVVLAFVVAGPVTGIAALAVALICRRGQTAAFFRWGQHVRGLARPRRRMAYLRDLAASTQAAKEIRMLGLADWIDNRHAAESAALYGPLWALRRRLYGRPFLVYTALGLAGTAIALIDLATRPVADVASLSIGLQAIVLCAMFGVIFPESDVKMIYGRSAWEALLEFERLGKAPEPPAADGGTGPADSGTGPAASCGGQDIVFEDVSFGYESGRLVLAGLDLTIEAGKSTALAGVNGAGKTTLVKLLTGLYQPESGLVTCGGTDIAAIDPQQWRRSFSVLFQDFVRYELTVRDNVAMGAVDRRDDDDGIYAELERTGLAEVVRSMPQGLETRLSASGTDGGNLSGGQWQRLALARSLFAVRHGASVLVLDEPTAQLDARGEAEFYAAFLDMTRGITSVIISHRFSSVRRADRIVTIEEGRLVESGTHDELIAARGSYATMFELQARRFARSGGTP